MSDQWEVREVTKYQLFRAGHPIVDEYNVPRLYASPDEALHVAANWEQFRAPTWQELQSMSDEELLRRAGRSSEVPQASPVPRRP